MNGERYLLDTNAIILLLGGDQALASRLQEAEWVGISVVSQLEFLTFPSLSREDQRLFATFAERVEVVSLSAAQVELIARIIELRQARKLKLPDAIIAGTALQRHAALVTADEHFDGVETLAVIKP